MGAKLSAVARQDWLALLGSAVLAKGVVAVIQLLNRRRAVGSNDARKLIHMCELCIRQR